MADNVDVIAGVATFKAATDKVTYSGDLAQVQLARVCKVSGAEDAKIVGSLSYHRVSAGSGDVQSIKGSAAELHSVSVFNAAVYPIFVKFHNTASPPVAGTGVARTVGVQAGTSVHRVFPGGLAFSVGLGMSIVRDLADSGVTSVATGDCVVDVEYT